MGLTSTKPVERFSLGRPSILRSRPLNHDSSKQKGKWIQGLISLEVYVFVFVLTRTKPNFLFYTPRYYEPKSVSIITFKIFSDQNGTECILQIKIDLANKLEDEIIMGDIVYHLSDLKQKEAGKKTLKARKHTNMDYTLLTKNLVCFMERNQRLMKVNTVQARILSNQKRKNLLFVQTYMNLKTITTH